MAKDITTPENTPKPLPAIGAQPAMLEDVQAERDRREAERQAKRPRILDCLDPTVAKYHEDRKPLYEWRIEVQVFRPAIGKQHAHMEKFDKNVVAQNDRDAWAIFCDSIGEWPSRRDAKPKFTRLKRRTLRYEEPESKDNEI